MGGSFPPGDADSSADSSANTDESTAGSDVEVELRELRTRAYGRHPDIEDDPAALARLSELEAARIRVDPSALPAETTPEPALAGEAVGPATVLVSAEHRSTKESSLPISTEPATKARPWLLGALAVGAVVAAGGIVAAIVLVSAPRPDAVLQPSGADPDDQLIALLESEGSEFELDHSTLRGSSEMEIDLSTLRAFGTYRDIELWSAVNAFESPCLIAVHRATMDVVARQCVPAGVDVFVNTLWHGLNGGERLRFFLRDDTVDAYLLVPEGLG